MTDERDRLAERFERDRARLRAVAYRMLGSASEAEDAVQETWLRLSRTDVSEVANLAAWLTTVVARVCLNMLRARESRREELAEADVADRFAAAADDDPEGETVLADAVGLAMLVVLDRLAPAERLAFVLHDMFAVPFADIGPMLDRSAEAARQLASRARRRVRGAPAVADPDRARQRAVVEAFVAASRGGDFDALVAVLHPDVVLRADREAGPTPVPLVVHGSRNVARGASAAAARVRFAEPALVDGAVGLVAAPRGRLALALAFTVEGDRITAIDIIAERGRLDALDLAVLEAD